MIRKLLLVAAIPAALAADDLPQRIDARIKEYVEAGLFNGVVLVARGDQVIYQKAFGLADRTFQIPNTPTTKFHIASLSKPITAAAVLLLAERGKLSLDDRVAKFVPDFPNGDRITVEQLLTHYSGLADASSTPEYDQWSRFPQSPASLVEKLAKLPMRSDPGKEYRYSNSNYHLLALIIEQASGRSYGEFLGQSICAPLGMSATAHHGDEKSIIPGLATGYMPKDADAFEKPPYFDWTSKTGNGSLYTTAGDLLKFHRALQHGGLLKPETVTASYGFGRGDRQVGMFWFRRDSGGHRSVYVGGSSPGFKAYFERFIDDDVAVIVLSNIYLASPTPIGADIRAILWQKEAQLAPVPKPVARSRQELARVAGSYQFGSDFYSPNALVRIEPRDGYLLSIYSSGIRSPLTPIANGAYFDRFYWSFIRFEDRRLIYRNGNDEFTATSAREPESPAAPARPPSSGGTLPHRPPAADAPPDRAR